MDMNRVGRAREAWKIAALLGAGMAAFATNQSIGVTLPVHIVSGLSGTTVEVGIVAAAGMIGIILGRILSAAWLERLGPSRLGAVAMALIALVSAGYLVAPESIVGLAAIRAVHGIAFAAATTALLVAMVTEVRLLSRQRTIALANLAMPVSGAIFPVLAIEVLGASWTSVAAGCVVIGIAGAVGFLFQVPSADPLAPKPPPSQSPTRLSSLIRQLPLWAVLVAALLGAADAAVMDYLPVLGTSRDISGYGWSYTVLALGSIASLIFISSMHRAASSTALVTAGSVLVALALAFCAWVDSLMPLLVIVGVYGVGFAIALTGINTFVAEWSPVEAGQALAAALLAFDLGRAVGVYLIGLLIDFFDFAAAFIPLAVALATMSCAHRWSRRWQRKQ